MQRASINHLLIGFGIAFALLIGIGMLGYQQNVALVHNATAVSQTHQVIARLANLSDAVDVTNTGVQLIMVTHASETVTQMQIVLAQIVPALADLRSLTADNAAQQQRLDHLEPLLCSHVAYLEASIRSGDSSQNQSTDVHTIELLIRAMEHEEIQQLKLRSAQSLVSVQRTQQIIIAGSLLGILIGLGTALVARSALHSRDGALRDLATLNAQLDLRVQQQTAAFHEANTQLTALSHQLIRTRDTERGTVATALHEAIGQEIAALQLNLQLLDATSQDTSIHPQLQESMTTIDRVLDQIRSLSFALHPATLDDFGLVAAIRASVEPLAASMGASISIDVTPLPTRPSTAIETACFRIAHEASTILLHTAGIQTLHIKLTEHSNVLELAMYGVGNDQQPIYDLTAQDMVLALLEIRERAVTAGGTFAIRIQPEQGSWISVRFPLIPSQNGTQ